MTPEGIKARLWVFVNAMYAEADLEIPFEFDPVEEARRVSNTLIAKGMGIRL